MLGRVGKCLGCPPKNLENEPRRIVAVPYSLHSRVVSIAAMGGFAVALLGGEGRLVQDIFTTCQETIAHLIQGSALSKVGVRRLGRK